jgi:hypothetical protein
MRVSAADILIVIGLGMLGSACEARKSPAEPTPVDPTPDCTFSIDPAARAFGAAGGAGTFAIATAAGCTWIATASAAWIVIPGQTSGSGPGNVSYTVAAAGAPEARSGSITVADRQHAISQDSGLCAYSVAPVEASPCMAAGTLTVALATESGCPWTARPAVPWLTVSHAGGNGAATLRLSFTENYDAPRTGIVELRWPAITAGQNVRVLQAGCQYAVSRPSFSFSAAGGTGTFDVFQQSDPATCGGALQDRCVWTASSSAAWIRVTNGGPHAGDDRVDIVVDANATSQARTGVLTVRDQRVLISQAGVQ